MGQLLSRVFSWPWLILFDGLNDSSTDIQPYLFADLLAGKILATKRHMGLASQVKAAQVLQFKPLDEKAAQDLLDTYIIWSSVLRTENGAQHEELPVAEKKVGKALWKNLMIFH